jgi:hypothetical protein
MPLFSRVLAVSLLVVLLPPQPAAAAPTTATLKPYAPPLTLAPGSDTRYTAIDVRSENAEPYTSVRLEVTVDLGGATSFADVSIEPGFGTTRSGSTEIVVEPGDTSTPCERADEKITCSWTSTPSSEIVDQTPALLAVKPLKTARTGDRAVLTMAARIGDGAVTNGTSVIQVGEGVNLVSDGEQTVKAAPGKTVRTTPAVLNGGKTAINGVVLVLDSHPRLIGPSSYRNCRYYFGMICTFDTTLEPGRRYALSSPVTLHSPADTVPGSVAPIDLAWITPADWASTELGDSGRAGTGPPLTLKPLAAAQDATPQVDVDLEDNFATIKFTVTGKRKPSLSAIGARLDAATSDRRTLTAGLMNFGPGTLRPDLFRNNSLGVAVRLPGNVAVEEEPYSDCYSVNVGPPVAPPSPPAAPSSTGADELSSEWLCDLNRDLGPGQRATFPFLVTVADECGTPGQVEIIQNDDGIVGHRRKVVPLSVNVKGAKCAAVALPITGPAAGWTALAALVLIAAGLGLAVRRTRRPVCAHAEGASGAGSRPEG